MTPLDWAVLVAAAAAIGFAKTAITGVGTLAVVGFAVVLPARESTGAILPVLIAADVVAITVYRRDAAWPVIGRLVPWVAAGVAAGVAYLAVADDALMRPTIGAMVLVGVVVAAVTLGRRDNGLVGEVRPRPLLSVSLGVAAGFATMVANAAGPLMALYLLASGLPVRRFVGTAAWFFFLVNVGKAPFSAGLGLLDGDALRLTLILVPAMLVGAWTGTVVVSRIQQRTFDRAVLALTALSALPLLF